MSDFEPLPEIPMDRGHMLEQATGRFRSVKDGLPELVKNSKDQYVRLGVSEREKRQIVVLISPDGRQLGVLDFAGARQEDFDGWQTWSSRTAGRPQLSAEIEAGHGNGGKSFMVAGARLESYMCSSSEHHLTKMGFKNNQPALRYVPGWFTREDQTPIRSLPDPHPEKSLATELAPFGLTANDLPSEARAAFSSKGCFTIVHLSGVADWTDVSPRARDDLISQVPERLRGHPQASLTVDSCIVWVLRGKVPMASKPLGSTLPTPYPSLERPQVHAIPKSLEDPESGDEVVIPRPPGSNPTLTLNTSQQNLRMTDRSKPLNVIRIRDARNIAATWSVADLAPVASSAYIFGNLRYPELPSDVLVGAERQQLADTPLVRALRHWTGLKVQELSSKIQQLQASQETPADRTRTHKTLQDLRDLMKQYIASELDSGPIGGGQGEGGGRGPVTRKPFGERVTKIVLEPNAPVLTMATGATVPLICKFVEVESDGIERPVKAVPVVPESSADAVLSLLPGMELKGVNSGVTTLKVRTEGGKVESNSIEVHVVDVSELRIDRPPEPLKQGERRKLNIVAGLVDGSTHTELVHEVMVDELEMGRIGRGGVFTAGNHAGEATVRIRYGPGEARVATVKVPIGDEKVEHKLGLSGTDIPQILLCGDEAAGYEDRPAEQRTLNGGRDWPTIIDFDPVWQDERGRSKVIWINPESTEAMKVRASRGPSGAMGLGALTVRQFLAQKMFEILRRLRAGIAIGDRAVTSTEFFAELAQAELDCAGFLEAAYDLVKHIDVS